MSNELVFYTNPMSRGRVVRWMLEEVNTPYDCELLELGKSAKAPEYLAINPMGKVPAIKHGNVVVTETAAICVYLADAFPNANLAPPVDSPLRGPYYRWLFFAAGPVEQAATALACGWQVPEGRTTMVGFGSLTDTLNTLENAIKGREFLVGDSFTTADLYVASLLGWGMQVETIEKRPAFVEYAQRLSQRPAAVRALNIDNELLAANA